jgi:integrase
LRWILFPLIATRWNPGDAPVIPDQNPGITSRPEMGTMDDTSERCAPNRAKISKTVVDALKPDAVVWDTEVRGFGVRCRTGGTKTYIVQYRAGSGRGAPLRKYTIGRHGSPWTPDQARKEARRVLGLVANGADPAAERTSQKKADTVGQLCDSFLAEHVEAKRKGRTATEYRRLIDLFIKPALGNLKASDVTRTHVSRLHHSLRVTPYQANRVLAVCSAMFTFAERWGLRPDGSNPCQHVEKFREVARERMLSAEELARLGDALAGYRGSPYVVAAVKLLVFTGARLSEVLGLRWEWIDFERGEARLPDSKTGAKTLHLPPPALAVLMDLPRVERNPHVIVGNIWGAPLVNLGKAWRAIRKQAGLDDVRIHDLRHAFASIAASSGMGLPIIGKMLGHADARTTQRYAHLAADPVKAAAATVANSIAAAMGGSKPAAVMPIRKSNV